MYSIKAFKQFETHRGVAYSANLYKGTKKVGSISNSGVGGMTDVDFIADDYAGRQAAAAEFAEWVRENLTNVSAAEFITEDSSQGHLVEMGAEMLIEWNDNAKASRKGMVYRIPAENFWEITRGTVNAPDSPEVRAWLRERQPDAEVWDINTHSWVALTPATV